LKWTPSREKKKPFPASSEHLTPFQFVGFRG